MWIDFILGHWERALEQADAFIAECESGSPHTNESLAREVRAGISRARGEGEEAIRHQLRAYELMIADRGAFHRIGALALLAATYAELGRDEARDLAVQIPPLVRETGLHGGLIRLAPYANALGVDDELRAAVAVGAGPRVPVWRRTMELILGGELSAAADVMAAAGNVTAEANLRKLAGLRLSSAGRSEEARADLERALAFYRNVGASAYVAEIESALAGAQSASA